MAKRKKQRQPHQETQSARISAKTVRRVTSWSKRKPYKISLRDAVDELINGRLDELEAADQDGPAPPTVIDNTNLTPSASAKQGIRSNG